jgi:hypothetical protein
MGALVGEDDVYIGSLFELFNLRFGVEQEEREFAAGGITEIGALQQEFKIFRKGRKFVESAKLLGLGGLQNNRAKNRWFKGVGLVVDGTVGQGGRKRRRAYRQRVDQEFHELEPAAMFHEGHDSRDKNGYGLKVVVIESDDPIFYIERPYLTISLPMAPKVPPADKKGKKK